MGDSTSWIAVRGKAPQQVRTELGAKLLPEGESSTGSLLAVQLENDWYLIQSVITFAQNDRLLSLSIGCEVVACAWDTHVMFSGASRWQNGIPCWAVTHNEERDLFDLATIGNLPEEFVQIRERLVLKQQAANEAGKNVDFIFDAPILLAESLTGFHRGFGEDASDFHLLAPLSQDELKQRSTGPLPAFDRILISGEQLVRRFWRNLRK
jgi:hypothetical protein